jgi:hypothetical protein
MAKTSKPVIAIHNLETNEIIEREMNEAEFAQYEIDLTWQQEREAMVNAKAQAKADLLNRLGITAEEAQLLLS